MECEEYCRLPHSCTALHYLNQSETILSVGTHMLNMSQLSLIRNNSETPQIVGALPLEGKCNAAVVSELNGLTFAATNHFRTLAASNLCISTIEYLGEDAALQLRHIEPFPSSSSTSCVCMDIDKPNNQIVQGTDGGDIVVYDIMSSQFSSPMLIDCGGLVKVHCYDSSVFLASVRSSKHPVQLIDLRNSSNSLGNQRSPASSLPANDYVTSIHSDKMNHAVACGTSSGSVLLWDLRRDDAPLDVIHKHHQGYPGTVIFCFCDYSDRLFVS